MLPTYCILKIIVLCYFSLLQIVPANTEIVVKTQEKLDLIEYTSEMLCSFQTKTIYVYFENGTSMGYPGEILRRLSDCRISCITLRNRVRKSSRQKKVKDDGILMYLLMIIHNVNQGIEISLLQKKSAAKHLTYVLLLIEDSNSVTDAWLQRSFMHFWRRWILNVAIMFWHENELQVYRYNPFMDNYLIKVNYKGKVPTIAELFPKALPNMQLKPLRICLYHDEIRTIFQHNGGITGSDGLMSAYITERLNATRIVNRLSGVGNFSLGVDICFREVAQEIDDVSLNIRFLSLPSFYRRVEYTSVISRDDLCVMVPKAKTATTFWNLFRSFERSVWWPILLSVPLAYGFCMVLYRRVCLSEFVLLQLFASTLSMPLTRVPLNHSLRVFLFCWLFYGMLIGSAFKGNLTSNLVFRTYLPDINTIKDLALSPYNLLLYSRHSKHLDRFLNSSNPYEAMIKRKMFEVPDTLLQSRMRSNNLSYAYLQKFHVAKFQSNARRHMRFNRPMFHVMDTCLVPFHAVFIVPYGSPYLGFINTLVRSSQEFGFSIYWDRMMNDEFLKTGKKIIRSDRNPDDPVVLKLGHFQAAFCLLTLGLLAAIVVLLWEIYGPEEFQKILEKM